MRLEHRTALVTGAGRGLGRAIAKRLAAEGAMVVVGDVDEDAAISTASTITKVGGTATAVKVDVGNPESAAAAVEIAASEGGALNILVNNAGINRDALIAKMTRQQWDDVLRINLTGVFNCLQPAATIMREQKRGRIVNISSAAWQGNIGQANYAASKAGVIGLTKAAAKELAGAGVTVNAVCPGFIETDMTRGVPQHIWDLMVSKIALGRAGRPEEVAAAVVFLASDDASYITGEVLDVGGGFTI